MITVLIADDHRMMREALAEIIDHRRGLRVVGQAADGHEAVELAARLQPDVITLEMAMPRLNGLDAVAQLRLRTSRTRILVLTAHEDDLYIEQALEAGVDGYLAKDAAADALTRAIRDLAAGRKSFSAAVRKKLPQYEKSARARRGLGKKIATLTPRETEVLHLIAEGLANKQIAADLGISFKTVEKHRQAVMDKIQLHDTASLTRYAIAAGLVNTADDLAERPMVARHLTAPVA